MKRSLILSVTMIFLLSVFSVGIASAAEVKAKGTLKSVDPAKGTIVFVADGSDAEVIIKVKADQIKTVKAKDKVKITYDAGKENVAVKVSRDRPVGNVEPGC
ncbi:MAG: hypothetical protein HZA22_12355 [Nitrospirae bacterium]|nr:hypothetical protein [Nitrospirota bacterium]